MCSYVGTNAICGSQVSASKRHGNTPVLKSLALSLFAGIDERCSILNRIEFFSDVRASRPVFLLLV